MRLEIGFGKAAVVGGCVVALGCSAGIPAVTSAVQAPKGYQVQAIGELPDISAVFAQLPKEISAADAKRLLVNIKEADVRDPGRAYTLQARGGHDRGSHTSSHDRHDRNDRNDRNDHRGRHDRGFFDNSFLFNSSLFGYYPYGNYMFPYYAAGSSYYPYTSNCTVPYLYRWNSYFAPYANTLTNPCLPLTTPAAPAVPI